MVTPCPLIEISGPPHARGVSYGQKAAPRIRRGISHYAVQIAAAGLSESGLASLVRDYVPVMQSFDPEHVEEMRGIAHGADVAFEHIALLNARTEILRLAERPDARARLAQDLDGCTGVVVMPEATADNRLIHAQNWDWKAECAETAVVLRIRRDDGPDILTFTEAGGLARSGLNSAGIAITANYLESDRDYQSIGVPLALIRRKVLQQQHVALAMHSVHATGKSASNNMMVSLSDDTGRAVAIDFECAPDEAFQVLPESGLLVHANHWISPIALTNLRDTGLAATPCSAYRDVRVRALLAPHAGSIGPDSVKTALFDDFATPWSVCRPPRRGISGGETATVAVIVMQPSRGIMEVAMLPALNRSFSRFSLSDAVPGALPAK